MRIFLDKFHCAKYRQKTRNRNRDLVEFEHNHHETTAGTVDDEPISGTSMGSPQAVHQETNQASASRIFNRLTFNTKQAYPKR